MPSYKILGIYSFADNLKKMQINDKIILKNEQYNIKSKNAIGVYSTDDKKLGYLPNEKSEEIKNFNTSYKISKLSLNQDYPIFEITREFPNTNFLLNVEYPFEKKIKYEYILVPISKELEKSVIGLEKYLLTKRLKVKRSAVIYCDENYVNILIEISKGYEQFQAVTLKYFKDNNEKFEELYENGLIENGFFRELLVYRSECYFEKNYNLVLNSPKINNVNLLKLILNLEEEIIHEPLENKKIDIILLVKIYIRYLLTENNYYLLKYGNTFLSKPLDDVKKIMKELLPNYKILKNVLNNYNLELGNFCYNHKLKLYDYIDFTNIDTVFIVANSFQTNYLYNSYLTNRNNIIVYNPIEGKIFKIKDIDLELFNHYQ
jgi:hypothetical protein